MMTNLNQPIRLLRLNRYGPIGSINSALDFGVRATLVARGAAEWVTEEAHEATETTRKPRREYSSKERS